MWKLTTDGRTTDGRTTDDGQRMITIVHLSLRLRCTKNEMHYINKKRIVLYRKSSINNFFLNNLFENLIQKAYFPIVYSLLFHDLCTLKCSCINLEFNQNQLKTNFWVKRHIILPNWDSDWTVTALSFYYRIVNVFNQQICLVNALHIFTSSFSATKSNSYLVASINSQHLNMVSNQCHNLRHFIMMDHIPLFSHLCHVDHSSQVVSIWLQSMYVTLKKN